MNVEVKKLHYFFVTGGECAYVSLVKQIPFQSKIAVGSRACSKTVIDAEVAIRAVGYL